MEKKYIAKINVVRYEEGRAEVEIEGGAKDLVVLCAMLMDNLAKSMHLEPVKLMAHLTARVVFARVKQGMAERASAKEEC